MVCAGEATGLSQSRRSSGLEIGCLIDTATGLLTFTSSGYELATFYQVGPARMNLLLFLRGDQYLFNFLICISVKSNYIYLNLNSI